MSKPFVIIDGEVYLRAAEVREATIHSAATNGQGEPVWCLSKTHGIQINVERAEGSLDAELERVIREACRKGYEAISKDFPVRPGSSQPSYELKTAETDGGQEYAAGYVLGVGAGLDEDFMERVRTEASAKEARRQSLERQVAALQGYVDAQRAASIKAEQSPVEADPYPETNDMTVILAWLTRRVHAAARRSGLV
ncbi:hypothetical protein [uncultured Pseudomonas sp.]|uniref:hypothetical protein n=1 Tax=uncultured Pseudomonas sp. TaxID=114707 RepID=UPI002586EFC9|nr:hypothetical protein [uncultured Pseudomonas sp.]